MMPLLWIWSVYIWLTFVWNPEYGSGVTEAFSSCFHLWESSKGRTEGGKTFWWLNESLMARGQVREWRSSSHRMSLHPWATLSHSWSQKTERPLRYVGSSPYGSGGLRKKLKRNPSWKKTPGFQLRRPRKQEIVGGKPFKAMQTYTECETAALQSLGAEEQFWETLQ